MPEYTEQHSSTSWDERATVEVERNSRGTNWKVGYSTQDMDHALEVVLNAVDRLRANLESEKKPADESDDLMSRLKEASADWTHSGAHP